MESDDQLLAQRMLGGEARAFEEFFETYGRALYRFAQARLGREAKHAEELTQVTLTKAILKLETYRGDGALFAWLCTFCRHEISGFYRKRARSREVELEEHNPAVQAALESAATERGDDPETSLHRKEFGERVHRALAELPPSYGDVLEWKYVDQLSARQIADRLGLSVKAAESLLTRARKAFRRQFAHAPRAPAWLPAGSGQE